LGRHVHFRDLLLLGVFSSVKLSELFFGALFIILSKL